MPSPSTTVCWSLLTYVKRQLSATHCHTLQHTATHCNTLQHTAAHLNFWHTSKTHTRRPTHWTDNYRVLRGRPLLKVLQSVGLFSRLLFIYINKCIVEGLGIHVSCQKRCEYTKKSIHEKICTRKTYTRKNLHTKNLYTKNLYTKNPCTWNKT